MNTEQYLEHVLELLRVQIKDKVIYSDEQMDAYRKLKPMPLGIQMIEVLNKKYKNPDKVDVYDFEKKIALTTDYPHLKEVLEAIRSVYLEENRELDANRVLLKRRFVENDLEYFCNEYDKLEIYCKEAIENKKITSKKIENQLYIIEDVVALCILTNCDSKYRKLFEEPNMGFLIEELQKEKGKFILFEGSSNTCLIELLAVFLEKMDKEVFLFKSPLCYEGEGINIRDTIRVSIENIQKRGNITYVYPVKIISKTDEEKDNISYLVEYINKHYNNGGHINIIGQGYQIAELSERSFINKKMSRLSEYYYDKREYNLALARYGDYLAYISKIYKEDCRYLLYKEPILMYSIVIPVRDSIETLKYTIDTCLEQTYDGNYEVLVSDNSIKNTDVYEFCKGLNDPRIKYIKTPRNLNLTKSFEYAYLHTSGKYIISLGADDGLLPWALDTLSKIVSEYPNELVIGWTRGFYAWPGFNNMQQHQLIVPNLNSKNELVAYYTSSDAYLARILENPQNMYGLPLLYINSCFRREMLHRLYEEVGELFDGRSQDIPTGILMIAMNKRILNISRPLTIAGMSSRSLGANVGREKDVELISQKQEELSMGIFVNTDYERLVPFVGTDVSAVYLSIMRAVSKGVISKREIYERIDWKKAFIQMLDSRLIHYISYYEDIYRTRYAAALHGEEFLQWYDEVVIPQRMTLYVVDEKSFSHKRVYETGMDEYGNLCLDASEYGVKNIYDAVELFEKIYKE